MECIGDGPLGENIDKQMTNIGSADLIVEIQKEVEHTVALGVKLGATNIELFEDSINKMVREEGSQEVYQ